MLLKTKGTMECPKCGKKGLVERHPDNYHCLWCGFQKDLSEPEPSGLLALLAIAFLVLFFLL